MQIWCISIVYASFVTGERLCREPFLARDQLNWDFVVGVGFNASLFFIKAINPDSSAPAYNFSGTDNVYDTSRGNTGERLDSKAEIFFGVIRQTSTQIPFSGTANFGPGEIFYATACSFVTSYIFLPSSYFHPSKNETKTEECNSMHNQDKH